MTDTASEAPVLGGRWGRLNDDQKSLLIAAAAVVVLAIAAFLYFSRSSDSAAISQITNDARGQLVTQDVSCHKLGFSVKTLTKQPIYYCNAKNVAQSNRPNGHIHESSFSRCYIVAVNGQTVDVSHAVAIEAKLRHKTIPCR
jgi:hypothetical protein